MINTLSTAMEYRPALLWLMGQIGEARTADVLAEFERQLGHLIPPEHREQIESGYIRWENFVHWARLVLVQAGFMTSGKRGVWGITAAGRAWLEGHPDGGDWRDITALARKTTAKSTSNKPAVSIPTVPVPPAKRQALQLRGRTFMLSGSEVLTAARAAMAKGMPREAARFKDWFLLVDGQRVSVKWVVGLVTGLPHSDFQTSEARRVLRTLGLEVGDAGAAEVAEMARPASFPESLDYSAFFRVVQNHLQGKLPASQGSQTIKHHGNYAQIGCPIPRSHYELRLGRAYTEIALHFEGKQEQNLKVLGQLRSHVEPLQAQLGEPVLAEPWGRDWARIYLRRAHGPMDSATAIALADDWLRFIAATLPILEVIARDLSSAVRRGRPAAETKQEDLTRQRAILADEIRAIRGFLAGNHSAAPSDEKLCDWVQFCYAFELFSEAASLFKLIRPEQVNSWPYERAKRLARACELHISHGR